ncbi:MAG: MBOAT family O-acyltransferase [Acidobacteriota bacterium]
MLFHSWVFWIFFLSVLPLFYLAPLRWGRIVLLVASYVFYMWWNPKFIVLILASTVVDYTAGRLMPGASRRTRRLLLVMSLSANLVLLGFFKYYNFFCSSVAQALGLAKEAFLLRITLPVGISFYTFQSMSYTIDVYWGRLKPLRNFTDFALFVAFFPQLVAGPIVRARQFLPQLRSWKAPTATRFQEGLSLVLIGLNKKMVFADHFAKVADAYFQDVAGNPGWITAWTGTLAFAMQILFDFSGYTDIARGCAQLMGFHFPVNFNRPYLAANISDFWRRWHISLSSWLRDYLYIPLGGNRRGPGRTHLNLMITMLLGGLWHGASWNFVVWGGYHGLLLSLFRVAKKRARPGWGWLQSVRPLLTGLATAINFLLVLFGWVFFRATSFQDAVHVFTSMSAFHIPGENLLSPGLWLMVGVSVVLALWEEYGQVTGRILSGPAWLRVVFYTLAFLTLELFSVTDEQIPFVYFQF